MDELTLKYQALLHGGEGEERSGWLGGQSKKANIDRSHVTSQVVNMILQEAIVYRASDIHIETLEEGLRVRFRIDGRLMEVLTISTEDQVSVIARLKVMAGLNTDAMSSRSSQDGRFDLKTPSGTTDFRMSTFPTITGEKVVLRLLGEQGSLFRIDDIISEEKGRKTLRRFLMHQHGLILVSGPTGSGKTTTLYALLNETNSPEKNVLTLEDPVEYAIPGINQCDIKTRSDFNFSDGLKAVLRQDPDVILVGEMRDKETSDIALRASITGHLVLSTIHANSAVGTVMRLLNMGLDPHMVSYAIIGALTQRLVRRICSECKEPISIKKSVLMRYGFRPEMAKATMADIQYEAGDASSDGEDMITLYQGCGCPHCHGTGYHGRVALFEIVVFDDTLREMIIRGDSNQSLKTYTSSRGMKSLLDDAFEKVITGVTTLDEIAQIIVED